MDVGRHCSTCGQLDFLPFDCRRCGKVLCSDHRVHDCEVVNANAQSSITTASQANNRSSSGTSSQTQTQTQDRVVRSIPQASRPVAKNPGPSTASAKQGSGQRLGSGPVKTERAVAALDRLKQLVGVRPSKPGSSASAVRNGASAELRRAAIGDYRVAQTDRVYFYIERPAHEVRDPLTHAVNARPAKTAAMYFDRQWSAGQILDRASRHLAVPNGSLLINGAAADLATLATDLPQRLTIVPVESH